MRLAAVLAAVAVLSFGTAATSPQSPVVVQDSVMTLADFQRLGWLLGRWRGAGTGALASVGEFHEAYTMVDDSTMLMRAYERPPFATATDSTRFEFRGGRILAVPSRGSTRMVDRLGADTVFWRGGIRYLRVSDNLWRALFPPRAGDPQEMYYEMRRMSPR